MAETQSSYNKSGKNLNESFYGRLKIILFFLLYLAVIGYSFASVSAPYLTKSEALHLSSICTIKVHLGVGLNKSAPMSYF